MKSDSSVFVKLNYKNIGEVRSLIIDRQGNFGNSKKYLMCAGKCDKNGWTIVFKARDFKEAEEIVNSSTFKNTRHKAMMYN
ncbi:hypothetical protein [Clostridium sp. Ade.TY]|uniref:hypothetical protein n=1 Tax=Clostridium sp. Ade.TY TaxID=1391647 RepID=UPI0004078C58|nr:hypothetical protein [Clostridium sp. Ade.TY]